MQVARMIAAANDGAPRTPLHGRADAEEIEGDQVEKGGDEENGPVTTKSP